MRSFHPSPVSMERHTGCSDHRGSRSSTVDTFAHGGRLAGVGGADGSDPVGVGGETKNHTKNFAEVEEKAS